MKSRIQTEKAILECKQANENKLKLEEMLLRKAMRKSPTKKKLFDNQYQIKAAAEVEDNIARVLLREDEVPTDRKFYMLMTSKCQSNVLNGIVKGSQAEIVAARRDLNTGRDSKKVPRGTNRQIKLQEEAFKYWRVPKMKRVAVKQLEDLK